MSRSTYRFADFLLDPAARELRRGDERTSLPPKSLECLIYLVEHRDRAVGRDELISAVWGRIDVSDALLAQTLLRARRAVGDSGNDQSSIRTVPRFGYQWIAPTDVVDASLDAPATPTVPAAPATPGEAAARPPDAARPRRVRLAMLAAAASFAIVVALVAWMTWRGDRSADAAAQRDLLVVAPVSLPGGGGGAAWVRLGVMDYIAARLRDAGLTVLPSERVAGLVAERHGESPDALLRHLRKASGAEQLLQPEARRHDDGSWQLRLNLDTDGTVQEFSGSGATPLAAADEATRRLLARLGRDAAASAQPPAATERLQRFDAAMLEGDLAGARALIADAEPGSRADPAMQVRKGQLAFRAGDLDTASTIFSALQAQLDRLPQPVQAQALMGLGALAVRRGSYAEAEQRYAEALAVLGPEGPQELIGNGFSGRGAARAAQGLHDLAASDLARARVALERAGDAPGVASVDTNLGLLESRSGKPASALQSFDRAIAVFERYGVRDGLAASLLGKARVQTMLADTPAALATAQRAWALTKSLENSVLIRSVGVQLADALRRSGRLAESKSLLDEVPDAPQPASLAPSHAQLALDRGDAARALAVLATEPLDSGGTVLLLVRATLGAPADAATRRRAAAALEQTNPQDSDDDAVERELGRALWQESADDAEGARAHFIAALARADVDGNVSARIAVLAEWLTATLRRAELDRATELAGQIAPYVEHDYRAAVAAAAYYRAVGDDHLRAAAEAHVRALAGERSPASQEKGR
jgi:DNA-binding winged helix-turn-helix (wHTH) protein/tetratricopeptide (TPR) repeat protein